MPTKNKNQKLKSIRNSSKIKNYYSNSRYGRLLLLLIVVLVGLIIFVLLNALYSSQKRQINSIAEAFSASEVQIYAKGLATDLSVNNVCSHPHPTSDFNQGPTYCGAQLTGKIKNTNGDADSQRALIIAELSKPQHLGELDVDNNSPSQFKIASRPQFECSNFLTGVNFTIDCEMRTYRAYYKPTD